MALAFYLFIIFIYCFVKKNSKCVSKNQGNIVQQKTEEKNTTTMTLLDDQFDDKT